MEGTRAGGEIQLVPSEKLCFALGSHDVLESESKTDAQSAERKKKRNELSKVLNVEIGKELAGRKHALDCL